MLERRRALTTRCRNPANRLLYARYKALAAAETDTLLGPTGHLQYYNMDQWIAQALTLAGRLRRGG